MKKIIDFLFSPKLTLIALLLLAAAMGVATFIENDYDTAASKILVYNTKWFELLFVILIINFIGNIGKYKLLNKSKIASFIFHCAFILMILGAAVTRYIGYEGSMHIREGETSNQLFSNEPYLNVQVDANQKTYSKQIALLLSPFVNNSFETTLSCGDNGKVEVELKKIIKNAVDGVVENVDGGTNIVELIYANNGENQHLFIKDGESSRIGNVTIAFNNDKIENAVRIFSKDDKIMLTSPVDFKESKMMGNESKNVSKDSADELTKNIVYQIQSAQFIFSKIYVKAKKEIVSGTPEQSDAEALVLEVSAKGKKQNIILFGGVNYPQKFNEINIDGVSIKLAYGAKLIELPFALTLTKFMLEKYPGSNSPSSYKSAVVLTDSRNNLNENREIFMNNVLDYGGYRFFQSSYDNDEHGTILSVNHDFFGTWLTYLGYILMGLGFFATLMMKKSRFVYLLKRVYEIGKKRKEAIATIALVLICSNFGFSQNTINAEHADKFGHLIVQNFEGRFQPLHTMAFDVMHKISRKDKFDIDGKGKVDAMQVFIDMIINGEFWKAQKIIYVREESVRNIIGVESSYASLNDFFNEKGEYKLASYDETAFQKKPAEQNKFDKEILKVDERINIFMMTMQGKMLKIFPSQNPQNNSWLVWTDSLAQKPIVGPLAILNEDLKLPDFSYTNLLREYFVSLLEATKSNNYAVPEKIIGYIDNIQRQSAEKDFLPSASKVDFEIHYNKFQIFIVLRDFYSVLCLILLLLAFFDTLRTKANKIITYSLNSFIALLGVGFLIHTYGLILRWYLSGHAPWSDGYEALLLVAWASLLAGFLFIRYSKIVIAATSVLAFLMLMTASHSSYDPQLTNLRPVLQSYWLIIHVATITISYGFLGLGFLLGIINMFFYLLKTPKNAERYGSITLELTYINEIALEVGVVLATIGTFLGGVWANESWGRYWSWDAKETWALVIVIVYGIILHFRLIPKLKNQFYFNAASIFGFGSVLMTFIGVNYYLSKGMHSYASGDTPVFPVWAWILILAMVLVIIVAGVKENKNQVANKELE